MTGSLTWITDDSWPSDEGWPYPDSDAGVDLLDEPADFGADLDDDAVSLHALAPHLLDGLDPLERSVLAARFGLDGRPPRSMRQIQHSLGLPRADLRHALGDGLVKLRHRVG
jgi:DNA-directed RNA polymerase sigma subunit (sigma70/sigma32)